MSSWKHRMPSVTPELRAAILDELRRAGPAGVLYGSMQCDRGMPPPIEALRAMAKAAHIVAVLSNPGLSKSARLWVTPEHVEECQRLLAEAQRAPKKADDAPVVPERTIHYATPPATALPAGYVSPLDPRECRPWAAVAARVAA